MGKLKSEQLVGETLVHKGSGLFRKVLDYNRTTDAYTLGLVSTEDEYLAFGRVYTLNASMVYSYFTVVTPLTLALL